MKTMLVTPKVFNTARNGSLHGSCSAAGWPIGSTLKLITNQGDELHADIETIEPCGTAYTVHLTNIRIIREGNPEPEHRPVSRRGVRPWSK